MPRWLFKRKRKNAGVLTDENSMSYISPSTSRQSFNNTLSTIPDTSSTSSQLDQEHESSMEGPDTNQTSDVQQTSRRGEDEIELIRDQQPRRHETQQVVAHHRAGPSTAMRNDAESSIPSRNEETLSSPRLPDDNDTISPIISNIPKDRQAHSTSLEHITAYRPRPWRIWRRIRPRKRYAHIHPDDRPYFKEFVSNAQWLDGRRICCGCCRIGADAILGLIPVVGGVAGAAFSLALVHKAQQRWRLPPSLVSTMYSNIFVDAAIGSIPIVGFFYDVAHKANMKNARLLEEHLSQLYQQGKRGITDEAAESHQLTMTLPNSADKSDSE
ncbi:hypothetical protein BDF22DRAFT_685060 [Syncephalis plumigaleata]|nr:hypothetical protein BDF22DRAFT_685060 [Syncephalis plumigaleata]